MKSALIALARKWGLDLSTLIPLGISEISGALRPKLQAAAASIQRKALKRLEDDGTVAELPQDGPFVDKDGVSMDGRQWFVHECLYAICRAARLGGTIADIPRDDHFASWGFDEANTLLAGVTDGAQAVKIVFDRLLEQI